MSFLYPLKHTNLKYSILNITSIVLKVLNEEGTISYSELLNILKIKIGDDVSEYFLICLSFLYIHKKIEYIKEIDSIRICQ
jgi:hypothetical protein